MKKKIIIAEDNADTLYMMVTALQERGYETLVFKDGVPIMEGHCDVSDLYILDNEMEYFDGVSIAHQRIMTNTESNKIPVLMESGAVTDADALLSSGVDIFLPKPFRTEELLTAVKKAH